MPLNLTSIVPLTLGAVVAAGFVALMTIAASAPQSGQLMLKQYPAAHTTFG